MIYAAALRYVPVKGLKEISVQEVGPMKPYLIVDVRQFQTAHHSPVQGSLNMPLAYLTRHFRDITQREVVIIASDKVEVNMSVKFLKRKGYIVHGYHLKSEIENTINEQGLENPARICNEI